MFLLTPPRELSCSLDSENGVQILISERLTLLFEWIFEALIYYNLWKPGTEADFENSLLMHGWGQLYINTTYQSNQIYAHSSVIISNHHLFDNISVFVIVLFPLIYRIYSSASSQKLTVNGALFKYTRDHPFDISCLGLTSNYSNTFDTL